MSIVSLCVVFSSGCGVGSCLLLVVYRFVFVIWCLLLRNVDRCVSFVVSWCVFRWLLLVVCVLVGVACVLCDVCCLLVGV